MSQALQENVRIFIYLPRRQKVFLIFNALGYGLFFGQVKEVAWSQGKFRDSHFLSAELSTETVHMLRLVHQGKKVQRAPRIGWEPNR